MAKVKVFLAWSGPRSQAVAIALRKWIPKVIQNLEPWMSNHDIAKGANWQSELSGQLQNVKIGIICLTPNNIKEPWINFEAGALSKLEDSIVCTYLHGLETTDVSGPLVQFQGTKADKEDTMKLIQALNAKLGEAALESNQLNETFHRWWGDLESDLAAAKDLHVQKTPKRDTDDMLREILSTLRSHSNSHQIIEDSFVHLRDFLIRSAETKFDLPQRSLSPGLALAGKASGAVHIRTKGFLQNTFPPDRADVDDMEEQH